jgi:pimeloyl-ACP methyl ester carboxylesterase
MSAILLHDEIVHYEVLGRGRPLVFLHDWVGSWRYWIPTMQAASISFRTYALDLWGFGDTAKNPQDYAIEQQTGLLAEFLQAMGIGKIALIGHGLGAIIALRFAARNPGAVDRAMAVSLPLDETLIHPRLRTSAPHELADWLLGRAPYTDAAREAARVEAPKADPKAIVLSLASLQRLDLLRLPVAASLPCVLVNGLLDPMVAAPPPEFTAQLPDQIHSVAFEQSGHYPMLDEPSKFNRLLADFLNLDPEITPRQLQVKEEWKRRVR